MNKLILKSSSPKETMQLAKKFASYLGQKAVVILTGDLGAGKTKFVEGFLEYFNLQDEISSPTFNIINEYTSKKINIYHFDIYRLEDEDEFYAIGGEEYFEKGICLIEWGEIIEDILPDNYIQIIFNRDNSVENKRTLEFKIFGNSKKYINILEKIKEEINWKY